LVVQKTTKFLSLFTIKHTETQLVEALHHKMESCGLDSLWCLIGNLHWHNPTGSYKTLSSTQLPKETSTRNISFGVKREWFLGWWTSYIYLLKFRNMSDSRSLNPQSLPRYVQRFFAIYFTLNS